jgi:hypothetical protein
MWLTLAAGWWYVGYRSFVHWWTYEWDYETKVRGTAFAAAAMGPLAWPIGRSIHNGNSPCRFSMPEGERGLLGGRVLRRCRRWEEAA